MNTEARYVSSGTGNSPLKGSRSYREICSAVISQRVWQNTKKIKKRFCTFSHHVALGCFDYNCRFILSLFGLSSFFLVFVKPFCLVATLCTVPSRGYTKVKSEKSNDMRVYFYTENGRKYYYLFIIIFQGFRLGITFRFILKDQSLL